jgi:hypothetical protein
MVGFYDGVDYHPFYNFGDFLTFVLRKRYHGWRFFAHFGGRFDVHYVFDWLREHEPSTHLEAICSGSCVIGLVVRIGRNRWKFVDSFRLMMASLERLTYDFDVQHKKLKGRKFTDEEYNRHDCMGLYEVLDQFFDIFDICSETIATHAMRVFRSKYLKKDIYQPSREVESFIRKTYFGGRCEIYRYDARQLYKYDVNSLYPAAMLDPVPIDYLWQSRKLPDHDNHIGFYRATVTYPERYLPVLPVKVDKLYFPTGRFEGYFTSPELRQAVQDGAGLKIHSGRIFHAEPLLAEYATDIYKMKQRAEREGKLGIRWTTKFLLNSLYGKFGQRRMQKTYLTDTGEIGLFPLPDGMAFRFIHSRASHIMPHIASTITARARLIIWDYLNKIKSWYTDTDSLFSSKKVPTADGLGGLKLEGRGKFQAHRLKEYNFEYMQGEEISFNRMAGFLESINAGQKTVRHVKQKKKRNQIREKRKRIGNDTRPWDMIELDET